MVVEIGRWQRLSLNHLYHHPKHLLHERGHDVRGQRLGAKPEIKQVETTALCENMQFDPELMFLSHW